MNAVVRTPDVLVRLLAERSPSERRTLALGAVALALLAFWMIALAPALDGIARLERQLPVARARAVQIEALAAEAKALRRLPPVASAGGGGDVRAALDASLKSAGIAPSGTPITLPSGDLRLHFTNVAYGPWSSWLAAAERSLGVHTVGVTAKRTTPGNVDVDLNLRLPRS